jgi:hypothetical protein
MSKRPAFAGLFREMFTNPAAIDFCSSFFHEQKCFAGACSKQL